MIKKSITDKYGKGAIMRTGSNQSKKVKGEKTDGEGKYLKEQITMKKKDTNRCRRTHGYESISRYIVKKT